VILRSEKVVSAFITPGTTAQGDFGWWFSRGSERHAGHGRDTTAREWMARMEASHCIPPSPPSSQPTRIISWPARRVLGKRPSTCGLHQPKKRPHHARFCIVLSSASARRSFGWATETACSSASLGTVWHWPLGQSRPPIRHLFCWACAAFLSVVPLSGACHSQSSTSSFIVPYIDSQSIRIRRSLPLVW
jgi:hypothetical protein